MWGQASERASKEDCEQQRNDRGGQERGVRRTGVGSRQMEDGRGGEAEGPAGWQREGRTRTRGRKIANKTEPKEHIERLIIPCETKRHISTNTDP